MHRIDKPQALQTDVSEPLNFLWLEITGRLTWTHLSGSASSSVQKAHQQNTLGTLTRLESGQRKREGF